MTMALPVKRRSPRRGAMQALFLAFLGAWSLTGAASPAVASVTVGQTAVPSGLCAADFDRLVPADGSGNSYVVPATGTITSWSHIAIGAPSQTLTMKLFRPLGGTTYMVVGHDTRPLDSGSPNTFPVSIAARSGDVLGLYSNSASGCLVAGTPSVILTRAGDLPDGASDSFSSATSPNRPNISAVLNPTNTFALGAITRNKKKGTATITVNVPNPGELIASGNGVKAASAGRAVISKSVGAGQAQLLIKAKRKKKAKLNETGKVKLSVAITYTPTGGSPNTQSVKVKLKKNL